MDEYMKELRGLVGSRPVLMCGASVILYNAAGEVLMMHRTDNDSWCFPGGALELGEKVEEAAAREALEETGLTVDQLRLFGVFSGKDMYYKYPNGDEVYNVDVVFASHCYHGEIRVNNEGREIRFFAINELPENISPPVLPVIEDVRKRKTEFYSAAE